MKNRFLHAAVILILLFIAIAAPAQSVYAADSCTGGQSCWYKDPATTTRTRLINGQYVTHYCTYGVTTVVYNGGPYSAGGANGTVYDELRWGSWCVANWARGTIYASNSTTKQLGTMASPTNSGYYSTDYYYVTSGTLPVGFQRYTWMVDGTYTVYAYAGIAPYQCDGALDSHNRFTGWDWDNNRQINCTSLYNPLAAYSG